MDYEDIRHEVISDIMSTEEGRQDLLDYATGKINEAREILEKYSVVFERRTGIRINLDGRYLEEDAYILMSKVLPRTYEQWKNEGFRESSNTPCITESVIRVLKNYEEAETLDSSRTGEIPEKMQNEIDASGTNEYVAMKIKDRITEVMQNARYYSARAIGMEPEFERLADELSDELRTLIQSVRPDEVKDILDREEHIILNRIDRIIDNALEIRRQQSRREEETKESSNASAFRDSMKVEGIDYSEIQGKQDEGSASKEKDDKTVKSLPTDFII